MKKLLEIPTCSWWCPHAKRYQETQIEQGHSLLLCLHVDGYRVIESGEIPDWCPLPDANQEGK